MRIIYRDRLFIKAKIRSFADRTDTKLAGEKLNIDEMYLWTENGRTECSKIFPNLSIFIGFIVFFVVSNRDG